MTYATKQNLIDRYGSDELVRLTDRTNKPPTTIDDTAVSQALEDADGEINGYLKSAGLAVPLDPAPSILIAKAGMIARYYLYKDKATEKVRTDYTDAIAWLKDVASGKVSLGDVAATATTPSQGPIKITGPARKFSDASMRDL